MTSGIGSGAGWRRLRTGIREALWRTADRPGGAGWFLLAAGTGLIHGSGSTPFPLMAEKKSKTDSKESDFRVYEERFTASPDPWTETLRLEPGADRTHASTIRTMVLNAEPAQRPVLEQKLLAVLGNGAATAAARDFACRQLALIGSEKCVAAVAPLLRSAATADLARYALDPLPYPSVDEAYRAALGTLSGAAKAGLIGSIALRGDRSALPALTALRDAPAEAPEVRTAAQRAVARLSNPS